MELRTFAHTELRHKINILKTEKNESTFLSSVPLFLKKALFSWRVPRLGPVIFGNSSMKRKMAVERWWNDIDGENCSTHGKACPVPLSFTNFIWIDLEDMWWTKWKDPVRTAQ